MRRPLLIVALASLIAVVAIGVMVQTLRAPRESSSGSPSASAIPIGGPFRLVDADGQPVSEKTLLGKPTVMFFGFTYCPEICPTTLTDLSSALQTLGRDGDKLNVVFVTVDPERDTPEQLKRYLANFDPRIRGFTGSTEAVEATAKAYRVYHRKVPVEGGAYTVDHTATVYLFDSKGRFVEPIGYGEAQDRVVGKLRDLIKS